MSFLQYKRFVEERDTVILCRGRDKLIPVIVTRGTICQIKGGAISHDDMIGKEYGSKIYTTNGKCWVTLLHPTPELWTLSLPHRTQIIYSTDISMITMQLELRPGSIVCECGTGSGSLSHAILRTIAPSGHLYTFEFHKQRAEIAEEEFKSHQLADIVTIECRDVCKDGFGLQDIADAVFLDVPRPWDAILSAKEAMKVNGGRICSFSPCIEQVQKTCERLTDVGFTGNTSSLEIDVIECLQRPFDVRPCVINIPDLGEDQLDTTKTQEHKTTKLEQEKDNGEKRLPHKRKLTNPVASSVNIYTCAPHRTIPGHTGFLTFATILPMAKRIKSVIKTSDTQDTKTKHASIEEEIASRPVDEESFTSK